MRFPCCCLFVAISLLGLLLPHICGAAEEVDFNRDIRPLLSDKCFQCHGPDAASREADLRLDVADPQQGPFVDRGGTQAIQPGVLDSSEVWQRIISDDVDTQMPPPDSHKEPLTTKQQALVKQWILQGAEYAQFWAFDPPRVQTAPTVDSDDWNQNRIDRFVMHRLQQLELQPKPQVDKRTLIRRVTFDLTGLPPTLQEIHDFLKDESADAYETLIDRLLASPRYGEHMAKYWLDLVRFADTNGIHHDHYREMTPYRDWVIRSFNGNLPFNDFVVDQIAGDLHDQPTIDQQIASGFNRLHLVIDKGTAIPEESFTRNVIDRVTAVGTAFMGLTVGCAVCHDHKYDPITQKDFFQLYAFFNNIDSGPETPGRGVHAPFIRLPNAEQAARLNELEAAIAAANSQVSSLEAAFEAVCEEKDDTANDGEKQKATKSELDFAKEDLQALRKSKESLQREFPVSLVMKERDEIRPTHILIRGAYDQPGELVTRDTPSFLPPLESVGDVKSRMDLARWLTDRNHPLTARVTVNRFWQQFFGVGLVKTSEDFGTQGDWPSHPELLDDLTTNFVASGWNVKRYVKLIVTSKTYQQSSVASPEDYKSDPDNRQLARGSRFRLDAEIIRDQILSISGLLNESMYGKSVKPPQPPNLWKTVSMASSSTYSFKADTGDKIYRRSLYSFWKRALPPPQMTIFDAPTREACTARRERTNTPLQALVLMNEGQYFKAAKKFAQKVLEQPAIDDKARLKFAYETITSRIPDQAEVVALQDGLNILRQTYRQNDALAKEMTADDFEGDITDPAETAAFTMLINSLFNLDITKTRD